MLSDIIKNVIQVMRKQSAYKGVDSTRIEMSDRDDRNIILEPMNLLKEATNKRTQANMHPR